MIAYKINTIADYSSESDTDVASSSPYWIVAVVQLGLPVSFNRSTMTSVKKTLSVDDIQKRDKPMVITDDCVSLSVNNSKNSHLKTMNATLKQGGANYLAEILPGDWVGCWMFTNDVDYRRVLKAVTEGKQANGPKDGLKFIGRANSIRKLLSVDKGMGRLTVNYNIQCSGFYELDSMLFYDTALATQDFAAADIGSWLVRVGLNTDALFAPQNGNDLGWESNINSINMALLDLFLGRGVSHAVNAGSSENLNTVVGAGSSKEAPFAYIVPRTIGTLLGKASDDVSKASNVLAYADILELLQGIQEYESNVYMPKLRTQGNRNITPTPLLGSFIPQMPAFTNRPFWSVLQQFMNPTVNEMYTCLRMNAEGNVVPTLVFRQIPFSTAAFHGEIYGEFEEDADTVDLPPGIEGPHVSRLAGTGLEDLGNLDDIPELKSVKKIKVVKAIPIDHTKFLSLPRWVVPSVLVTSANIGRSDATRCNFVYVYGVASEAASQFSIQEQIAQNPPIRDDIDIQRSGLRSYMTTVDSAPVDQAGKVPSKWMSLISDWTMGSHLTLNGTLECMGIQSPIVEGDNIEWDGVVYHIESVNHTGRIDPFTGMKQFSTVLTLTNGMRGTTDGSVEWNSGAPIYAGATTGDQQTHDPKLTVER